MGLYSLFTDRKLSTKAEKEVRKEKPYSKSKGLTSNLTGQRKRSHTVSQREVYCFVSQRELTGYLAGQRKEEPYSKSKELAGNIAGQKEEKPLSKSKGTCW